MTLVTIMQIEDGINRCTREIPAPHNSLSAPARALADIYGTMIHEKKNEIDLDDYIAKQDFAEHHVAAVKQFCITSNQE